MTLPPSPKCDNFAMESLHFVFIFANHLLYCRETFLDVGESKSRNNTLIKKDSLFVFHGFHPRSRLLSSVRTLQSVLPHFRLFLCTLACPSTVVSAAQPGLACSGFQFLQMGPDILCGHLREVAREGERRERERGAIMEHCFPPPPPPPPPTLGSHLFPPLRRPSSLFPRRGAFSEMSPRDFENFPRHGARTNVAC